jgi:hypothetical protein
VIVSLEYHATEVVSIYVPCPVFLEGIIANHARSIVLSEEDRLDLEGLQRSPSLPAGVVPA